VACLSSRVVFLDLSQLVVFGIGFSVWLMCYSFLIVSVVVISSFTQSYRFCGCFLRFKARRIVLFYLFPMFGRAWWYVCRVKGLLAFGFVASFGFGGYVLSY
jgi:hypothetical protein